jgi:hypothetical protein
LSETKEYKPAAVEMVDCAIPVAWLERVTLAPGTTAPLGSVTVPLMPPRPACAQAIDPAESSRRLAQSNMCRKAEVIFLIILAIPHQFVDIQTFE